MMKMLKNVHVLDSEVSVKTPLTAFSSQIFILNIGGHSLAFDRG